MRYTACFATVVATVALFCSCHNAGNGNSGIDDLQLGDTVPASEFAPIVDSADVAPAVTDSIVMLEEDTKK